MIQPSGCGFMMEISYLPEETERQRAEGSGNERNSAQQVEAAQQRAEAAQFRAGNWRLACGGGKIRLYDQL